MPNLRAMSRRAYIAFEAVPCQALEALDIHSSSERGKRKSLRKKTKDATSSCQWAHLFYLVSNRLMTLFGLCATDYPKYWCFVQKYFKVVVLRNNDLNI